MRRIRAIFRRTVVERQRVSCLHKAKQGAQLVRMKRRRNARHTHCMCTRVCPCTHACTHAHKHITPNVYRHVYKHTYSQDSRGTAANFLSTQSRDATNSRDTAPNRTPHALDIQCALLRPVMHAYALTRNTQSLHARV